MAGAGRVAIVALIGCGTSAAPMRPVSLHAKVTVASTMCLVAANVDAHMTRVLGDHHAEGSGLVVEVITTPIEETGADVQLRVLRPSGEVGLDRHYTLASQDCDSAPQLLALGLDRWLTSFPEWAEPPSPPSPPPARWSEVLVASAVNGIWPPLGIDGQLGLIGDVGNSSDRFGGSLLARVSVPQHAGGGRFQQFGFLAGATWRHPFGPWQLRVELRGGGVLVRGLGFSPNGHSWLPWWEVAAFGGRSFRWGSIGLEVAATALRDHAVTRDLLVSEDIPLLRVGLSGSFGLHTHSR